MSGLTRTFDMVIGDMDDLELQQALADLAITRSVAAFNFGANIERGIKRIVNHLSQAQLEELVFELAANRPWIKYSQNLSLELAIRNTLSRRHFSWQIIFLSPYYQATLGKRTAWGYNTTKANSYASWYSLILCYHLFINDYSASA